MVGYHGESSRETSQRQSLEKGRTTQTGSPSRTRQVGDRCVGTDQKIKILKYGGRV